MEKKSINHLLSKIIVTSFLFSIFLFASAQISIDSKVIVQDKSQNITLEIVYCNNLDSSIVLWLQNWRITPLYNDTCFFHGIPTETSRVNFVFLINDSLDIYTQFDENEEYTSMLNKIEYSSIKILKPNDKFKVIINIVDSRLTEFLRRNHYNIALIYSYEDYYVFKRNVISAKMCKTFYESNMLNFERVKINYTNTANDVTSFNFDVVDKEFFQVDNNVIPKLFKKYIYISKGLNTVF